MRTTIMILGTLVVATGRGAAAAEKTAPSTVSGATAPAATPRAAATGRRLFLDVHDIGRGKVTMKGVAGAHQRDLAAEAKHGVAFKAYWVDEQEGKIYCLAEAPSREAINDVHKQAHGLTAARIMEVTADNMSWTPTPGAKLYFDVHRLGAGKVTAQAVAAAHQKDLAVGPRHGVKYINYWLDEQTGTVMCLAEAPSAEAAVAVHKEAHGLVPDSIEEVSEGR